MDPHVKDKTVWRPSYLSHGNPHTWERRALYWDGPGPGFYGPSIPQTSTPIPLKTAIQSQSLVYSTRRQTWQLFNWTSKVPTWWKVGKPSLRSYLIIHVCTDQEGVFCKINCGKKLLVITLCWLINAYLPVLKVGMALVTKNKSIDNWTLHNNQCFWLAILSFGLWLWVTAGLDGVWAKGGPNHHLTPSMQLVITSVHQHLIFLFPLFPLFPTDTFRIVHMTFNYSIICPTYVRGTFSAFINCDWLVSIRVDYLL